jgi:TonB-linked SusC/RagA family outer membrane protein
MQSLQRPSAFLSPTPPRRRRALAVIAALASAVILLPPPLAAQEGTVSGVVVEEGTERPLASARVSVPGTGNASVTDAAGRFRIGGLTPPSARLEIARIGYASVTRTVTVGAADVRIALSPSAVALDALVVTGTAGRTERRAVGNAVTQIDAAQVVRTAPVNNLQDLVNGRSPGVVIMPGTGVVGGGARIRVRGVSSLSLSNEPLLYVDGVRVNNAQGTGPTTQGFGSSVVSRINDFNPEDIESIEIIKGPAASTLYGTEAANGVIQIITKKGAQGSPQFNLTVRQGANWLANPEGRLYTNWGPDARTGEIVPIDIYELEKSGANTEDGVGRDIFQTGHLQEYTLNVSGGNEIARYYVAGSWENNNGIEPNNELDQYSGRVNVSVAPHHTLDLSANAGYVKGRTDLSIESGGGGITWSTFFASPTKLYNEDGSLNFRRGFWSGTPEAYYRHYQDWQDINRFTGGLQVNHRPMDWLSQRLAIGTDQTRQANVELVERNDDLRQFFGSETQGYRDQTTRDVTYNTVDYSLTAEATPREGLTAATSFGAQYYGTYDEFVSAFGRDFPAPGLKSVSATTQDRTGSESYVENKTFGVFVQEQLGWRDRIFLTGAVRADDNSAFGKDFNLVYYPKLSATWVLSEEPFLDLPWLDALKLRAAYGQSGQQPETFSALRYYLGVAGPNGQSAVTPGAVGNPGLGPERSKEIELGFDASFLDDRAGLELTYYNNNTEDAILLRDLPPSSGFSGSQFFNAGEIRNRGVELLARGRPLALPKVTWDLTFTLATNSNEVLSLGDPDLEFVSAGRYLQHRVGFPVGSWFERKLVSAELDADGDVIESSLLCDNGSGGTAACSDAPPVFLGRNTPKYEGAVNTTLTLFDRLALRGLVDFKTGQSKLDGNRRVRCWFFGLCRENYFPLEFDPVQVAGSEEGIVSDLIEDASFTKLRELSATYTVPETWANRIGAARATITVAGRNLYTWTAYPGLEPEAMFLGGSRGGGQSSWEQNVVPQLTQFVTTVNLTF